MKDFEYNPAAYSKKEIFIGGIKTFVYNTESLAPYIEQFNGNANTKSAGLSASVHELPVNVHYLVHYRGGDYTFTESVAYNVLQQYYAKKEANPVPLICITFDNRNHGTRVVDKKYNSSWKSGNETHGLDMMSQIHGNVQDLKLITEYLPGYLNLEYHLSDFVKYELEAKIKFRNIFSGYSVGGHTVIRFAHKYPELVQVLNPVVGCSALTNLLVNRLLKYKPGDANFDKKWFYSDYRELPLTDEQRQRQYPEAFHNQLSQEDIAIFENFPFASIDTFASFGADDALVPPSLTKLWIELYENNNQNTSLVVYEGVGHDVTAQMIDEFTSWLVTRV